MRRLLLAAAIGAATLFTGHPSSTATGCAELFVIYRNGVAVGGDAWCAGHTSWRVVAGFAATRYGTPQVTRYGLWNSRYESVVYGTTTYPYVRWVSYQTSG